MKTMNINRGFIGINFRHLFRIALILLTNIACYAQQDPAYSHFMYNGLAVNPAVAGSAETFSATGIMRKQWAGIEGAPETQTLNVDAPVWNNKIGLGLSIINDKIGVIENLSVNAQYAYRLDFGTGTFSFGLQGGMNSYKADFISVVTNSQSSADNSFGENTKRAIFNFGTGAYYYSEKFFAGVSIPHIINQRLDGIVNTNGEQSRQYRHYFITGGYVIDAADKIKVKPSALIKIADGAPVQLDINASAWYDEKVSVGFSYRTNDSFTTMLQIQLAKRFRVGYAYDFIISSLSRYTTGNNELMLRYELRRDNSKILTPRYF
jgi:type IX secretion system PorP/SprF family membrane protein